MTLKNATDAAGHLLYTVGYEGRDQAELIRVLCDNRIGLLLDIRARASSRKSGFSKTLLAASCAAASIQYIHDRQLGTPRELMAHVRSGVGYDTDATEAYRAHLLSLPADILDAAAHRSLATTACLLCYERDPTDCHRKVVAEEIAKRTGSIVRHI